MKTINYLVFIQQQNIVNVVPIQDGEQPYTNTGIKLRTTMPFDDGFGVLTEEQLQTGYDAIDAINEIVQLVADGQDFQITNATYHHEITDEGEYVKGNNVIVELKKPITIDEQETKSIDTGNLRDYAAEGEQQADIKDKIDAWGLVCTLKLNQ